MQVLFRMIEDQAEMLSDASKWLDLRKTSLATVLAIILTYLSYQYDILNINPILKAFILALPFILMLTSFINMVTRKYRAWYILFVLVNTCIMTALLVIESGSI